MMNRSESIRKEILFLASIGEEIHIRKMARRYKCSPSLVMKNLYKVVRDKNLIYRARHGRKGKVILEMFTKGEQLMSEHLNENRKTEKSNPVERMFTSRETKGEHLRGEQKEKEEKSFPYNPFKKEEKEGKGNIINNIFKEESLKGRFLNAYGKGSFKGEILNAYGKDLNAYEKRILSFYLSLGGKIGEGDVGRVKEILNHLTPSQFEAVALKIIREKQGELPNLSYLLAVAKRLSLKTRKVRRNSKERAELFKSRRKNSFKKDSPKKEEVVISFRGKTGEEAIREFFKGSRGASWMR